MALARRLITLLAITTLTNAADDTSITPHTMTAFGTLERGGWAALQRLDASALCASRLVAQDETPCYCGDAADDCFEHPDVIRDLTKYVDEDDDDDDDDVEAIAPAPRQAPPAGWGKLLSA